MPMGTPMSRGDEGDDRGLPGDRGGQLPGRESERLQEGEVSSSSPDRRDQGEGQCDDGADGKSRREDDGCGSSGLVVDDFRRVLDTQDFDRVAGRVRVGGEDLVGELGNPVHVRQPRCGAHRVAEAHEDQPRSVERGVRLLGGVEERWADMVREDGSGSHGRVVGEVAGAADGGECGRAGDHQLEGRDVERGGVRGAERTDDGVADTLVQECQRAGTQDDLVVRIDPMSGKDRRSNGRVVVAQEGGDGLAVDLNREVVVARPGRNVMVPAQDGESLRGHDIF